MKNMLLVFLSSIVSSIAFGGTWGQPEVITNIEANASVYIATPSLPQVCTSGSATQGLLASDAVGNKNMLALALTALVSGRKVRVFTEPCSSGYPKITDLQIF